MTRKLSSLEELSKVLLMDNIKVLAASEHALGRAAKLVQKDAQARIGEYQNASGPFPEWEQLADSTEAEKARLGFPADAPLERTGELRNSIVTEQNHLASVIGSKLEYSAYQEFGTANIPPRPFLGPAVFDNKKRIHDIIGAAVVNAMVGENKVHPSLGYDLEV